MELDDNTLMDEVHRRANVGPHLNALFDLRTIGPVSFIALARHCLERTQTQIPPYKAFRRFERLSNLLLYALYAHHHTTGGRYAECGVLRGFSARAVSILLRENSKATGLKLRDLWLVDSFEGLSEPTEQDWVRSADADGTETTGPRMQKGHFATPLAEVQKVFAGNSAVSIVKGWIPQAFENLPDSRWAFVHLDVDLYQPIKNSLEYFYPRLVPGSVIINDDFGSAAFPGA